MDPVIQLCRLHSANGPATGPKRLPSSKASTTQRLIASVMQRDFLLLSRNILGAKLCPPVAPVEPPRYVPKAYLW